jgi:mannosyltransferase
MGLERGRPSTIVSAVGLALVIIGLVLPSALLLGALGVSAAAAETRRLWLGAALFRLGLGVLGLYLVAAGRLAIWKGGTAPAEPRLRWARTGLAGVLLVSLLLRLRHLSVGLWIDEINVYVRYMGMSFGQVLTTYDQESQHFLFTLLARAAFTLLGEGPTALRLPAVLFGVGSVAGLYLLARRVTAEREALLSAALMSVSYHHVWFSQNARGYSALLFWTLLSSWLLLRALDEGRSRLWLGYAAAVALGMFTHVTMLFIVLAHAAVYATWLVRHRPARGPLAWSGAVLGFGLAALFTFQLYALVLPQFLSTIGETTAVAEWSSPLWTVRELARGLRAGFAGSAVAAALVVFGVGLVSFARTAPVIVGLLILPAAVGATAVVAMGHALWPRFFFFLMGFGVLIAVRGAVVAGGGVARAIGLTPTRAALVGTAAASLLILASAATVSTAWLPKQDYLGAQGFVEAQREPGDAIVTVGLTTFPYGEFYRTGWEAAGSVDALNAIRARARRTWLVYSMPLHLESQYPEMMAAIRADFTLISKFGGTLNGGTIYVCRAEGAPVAHGRTARRRER